MAKYTTYKGFRIFSNGDSFRIKTRRKVLRFLWKWTIRAEHYYDGIDYVIHDFESFNEAIGYINKVIEEREIRKRKNTWIEVNIQKIKS